jgi:superfamily II DNA or RNA helicase
MSLNQLRSFFDSAVMQRGLEYKRSGRVTLETLRDDYALLNVRGSTVYLVEIQRLPDSVACGCDCPYFESDGPCKHIWASLLLLDEKRALGPPWPGELDWAELEDDPFEDDEPIFADEIDDDGYDAEPLFWRAQAASIPPEWRERQAFAQLEAILRDRPRKEIISEAEAEITGSEVMIRYVIDIDGREYDPIEVIHVEFSRPKKSKQGGRTKFMALRGLTARSIRDLREPVDRELLLPLVAEPGSSYASRLRCRSHALPILLPKLCGTGRFFARSMSSRTEPVGPLALDHGGVFRVEGRCDRDGDDWVFGGELRRGSERLDPSSVVATLRRAGVVITRDAICHLVEDPRPGLLSLLDRDQSIRVPVSRTDDLVKTFASHAAALPFELPAELGWEETRPVPRPVFALGHPGRWARIDVQIAFDYDGTRVDLRQSGDRVVLSPRVHLVRDLEAEKQFLAEAKTLGVVERWGRLEIEPSSIIDTLRRFAEAGWIVELAGRRQRFSAAEDLQLVSGIDWFDLRGHVTFNDGLVVGIPELLRESSGGSILLDDGSEVLLDEGLSRLLATAKRLGETSDGGIRFRRNQSALLDALLETRGDVRVDETWAGIRDRIRNFAGIAPEAPPKTFDGALRDYQKTALGWFRFLREMHFGGCLADDMGLGKTVQVLALLESRRRDRKSQPSIVVAPRSVVYNWIEEARRFAPALRVRDHSSPGRATTAAGLTGDCDVVLVTYGTLRRDAELLASISWDYAVLDESQAIKNPSTATAKAARLLDAKHRLALSGTPIENHLGELWSLMQFLNPGVLGRAGSFAKVRGNAGGEDAERAIISRAVRPFILRRTKAQVAPELPDRTEQTIHCELQGAQRRLYDELREHYRRSLLGLVEEQGIARSKIHVLEALLRLRQAACHPDLVRRGVTTRCAKLDALLPALDEVVGEGHKVLVFSQFTSFLQIVRDRLSSAGIEHLYLDGATRKRGAMVDAFQRDDRYKVFLISLKAGGLGLNLTAAEYVYLLDPWWNPAVEAQAIDRAHRIGQTRNVMAYRIVARDTIEEKIITLQNTKRALADAILGEDKSFVSSLTTEDLELLLA